MRISIRCAIGLFVLGILWPVATRGAASVMTGYKPLTMTLQFSDLRGSHYTGTIDHGPFPAGKESNAYYATMNLNAPGGWKIEAHVALDTPENKRLVISSDVASEPNPADWLPAGIGDCLFGRKTLDNSNPGQASYTITFWRGLIQVQIGVSGTVHHLQPSEVARYGRIIDVRLKAVHQTTFPMPKCSPAAPTTAGQETQH